MYNFKKGIPFFSKTSEPMLYVTLVQVCALFSIVSCVAIII